MGEAGGAAFLFLVILMLQRPDVDEVKETNK